MRRLRAAVSESAARVFVFGGWWRTAVARLLGVSQPSKAELVWIPAYHVVIPMHLGEDTARYDCAVDGLSGAFSLVAMGDAVEEGDAPDEMFPPRVTPDEANRIARSSLVAAILRRRRKSARAQMGETESIDVLLWPYWVFYHSRRRGHVDIQLLDAATGIRPGHKIKLGLLEAFRASARNQTKKAEGESV